MSKLQEKLREAKNKRARADLLKSVEPSLFDLLSTVEFSQDVQCLKFAAFSTWDANTDEQSTTRGKVEGWRISYFDSMSEIIRHIKDNSGPGSQAGWFFIDTDGPYYSITLSQFIGNLSEIRDWCELSQHFDIGWVGEHDDCGIIVEFEHTSFCRNQLEVCVWGM